MRSVYSPGTVTDILLTSTLGLSCVPPSHLLFSLPWRDPHLLVVPRYDARLILDSLSTHPGERRSGSPSGWSDLPSDTEDTFFLSRAEAEDYRRDKRRRLMESAREERLRALELLEPTNEPQETCWASDEEVCIGCT